MHRITGARRLAVLAAVGVCWAFALSASAQTWTKAPATTSGRLIVERPTLLSLGFEWLIDGDAQTVHVYRTGHAPKIHRGITKLSGDGPVAGFTLQLTAIWKGLS